MTVEADIFPQRCVCWISHIDSQTEADQLAFADWCRKTCSLLYNAHGLSLPPRYCLPLEHGTALGFLLCFAIFHTAGAHMQQPGSSGPVDSNCLQFMATIGLLLSDWVSRLIEASELGLFAAEDTDCTEAAADDSRVNLSSL